MSSVALQINPFKIKCHPSQFTMGFTVVTLAEDVFVLSYIVAFVRSQWKPILNFLFIQVNKIDDFIYISNIDVKILSTLVTG